MFSEKHASATPTETDSQKNPVWEIPISDSENPVGPLPLLDHGAAIQTPVWEVPISDSANPVGPLPLLDHGATIPDERESFEPNSESEQESTDDGFPMEDEYTSNHSVPPTEREWE